MTYEPPLTSSTIYRTIPFKIAIANTYVSRLKGLMYRREPLVNEGLWLIPCNSIHTSFMYFPIDVVFLDKDLQMVKLCPNVQPWRMIGTVKNAHSVLEIPAGSIDMLQLECGQYIKTFY